MDPTEVRAVAERFTKAYTRADAIVLLSELADAFGVLVKIHDGYRQSGQTAVANSLVSALTRLSTPLCSLCNAWKRFPREPGPPQPPPGGSLVDALAPQQASRMLEYFPGGSYRVLLVGEIHSYSMHWIKAESGWQSALCEADFGRGACCFCGAAAVSREGVQKRQVQYAAAAFVQSSSDGPFRQKVALFPPAAGEAVVQLVARGPARGQRFDVERLEDQSRFKVIRLPRWPKGFPAALPPSFSPEPFLLGCYGLRLPPEYSKPILLLPDIIPEKTSKRTAAPRVRPLELWRAIPLSTDQLSEPSASLGAEPAEQRDRVQPS